METRAKNFVVAFWSNEGLLKIVPSKEKNYDGIVLGKVNQCFTINIQCSNIDKPYAAKLYIDDQEVVKCKTFKKRGNFFGFRRGNGHYDRFLFKMPTSSLDILHSDDSESLKKKGRQMGEIRIVFFNAQVVWKRAPKLNPVQQNKSRGPSVDVNYTQVPKTDVKNNSRSLSVGLGQGFQLDMPPLKPVDQGPHKGMIPDTKALFDEPPIDQIVIRYSHVATTIAMGILNPLQDSSMEYFPLDFVKGNNLIMESFYQTLQAQKLSSSEIVTKFETLFQSKVEDLYPGGIAALIKNMKQRKEKITRQDIIQAIAQGEFMKFCVAQAEDEEPASQKEEKKFLGKRSTPARELPKKPKNFK